MAYILHGVGVMSILEKIRDWLVGGSSQKKGEPLGMTLSA